MRRGHLAVDEEVAAGLESGDERGEADLRGVGFQVEHRFAVEEPAEGDAVEPPDQLSFPAHFDAMGDA